MRSQVEQLNILLKSKEDEHLEFKEAKSNYDFEKLLKYCSALANEGGGKIILGVLRKKPRKVIGSSAFLNLESIKLGLVEKLHIRIDADEVFHPDGRVLIFHVPPRPIGYPIPYKGAYWMRLGESLVPMTPDQLKKIFYEAEPDFSGQVCKSATFKELDTNAIEKFRNMWIRKSRNQSLASLPSQQLLQDAELLFNGRPTYAALILFGTRGALGKHLSQSEVIFEYRANEPSISYQQRKEFRQGFFSFESDIVETINLRNDIQHYQEGLFVWDIPTFNEKVIREALLNAVSHRDYHLSGSIFIRQFPRKLEIISPGGFPPGVTTENILWRQAPRNRRIAEVFAKCGLVERSGQGMDRMFEECIKEGKPKPDFSGTDDYQVSLTLRGEIQDPKFLRFLEKIGKEKLLSFSTIDLLILDQVYNEQAVSPELKSRIPKLIEMGAIESIGPGKGVRYILSRRFHSFIGKKGQYTRKRGLDRETNKELLLKHINDNQKEGSKLKDLVQVLPQLPKHQFQNLLRDLKAEDKVYNIGKTKAGRWYPGPKRKRIT